MSNGSTTIEDTSLTIVKFITAIHTGVHSVEDVDRLRHYLDKLDRNTIQSWSDDQGLDVLHHAIMSNNIECLEMIFAKGHFKPPLEPKSLPYIHMAASLGHRAILFALLQARPSDNRTAPYSWKLRTIEVGKVVCDGSTKQWRPLDIAAEAGHAECVKAILDFDNARKTLKLKLDADNYLYQACEKDSPSSLRLLLLTQKPSENEIKSAVGVALKTAKAECLDILLRHKTNITNLFGGMNLYHVLYSYSMSFDKTWYESLLTVTSVLIKHGQNFCLAEPFRTYPLYSLLSHSPTQEFENASQYLIACLLLLLNAGANPNFNEEKFEVDNESSTSKTAFGRSSFASALHCIFETVGSFAEQFKDSDFFVRRYTLKCAEILLKHHANPNITGRIGESGLAGNALHAFLSILPAIGVDQKMVTCFKLLIHSGADPNSNPSGKYPVNVVCDAFVSLASSQKESKDTQTVINSMKYIFLFLLDNMNMLALRKANAVYVASPQGRIINPVQENLVQFFNKEFAYRSSHVWPLKSLCKCTILIYCGRKFLNVMELPLPQKLKNEIVSSY
ncbi:hypothetical protein CHS0354_012438 [Potamilus streckersoni]|uniref:SOCS box domain-containing protein n=1 Tax=Potamilus streckersoni TaxID=2493646 RepID=A0AAE0RVQ9_9BIVA|nr:hypothetical protein CHS0354_012438 [Potamilus streckersoni]